MTCSAKVVLDSISKDDARLCTLELTYPRFIHSELMTHRAFSRNASSSRAIPVRRMLQQVEMSPVVPWHWGSNKPGMQAGADVPDDAKRQGEELWRKAATSAAYFANEISQLGVHKQICNRLLEPFQLMKTLVTATEWDNFYELRLHEDAEPHFRDLAVAMRRAMDASLPIQREVHTPYVDADLRIASGETISRLCMVSSARCARVSYMNHDGSSPDEDKDLGLATRLLTSKHMSPFEHAAIADDGWHANFYGWRSYRTFLETK